MTEAVAGTTARRAARWRARPRVAGLGRAVGLFVATALMLAYVLGPVGWMVSSSLQNEAEIT